MDKKSNLSLYILRFKDKPLIKIGLTENLAHRIKCFRKEYNEPFSLTESYLVGSYSAARISALEKELLANTDHFKVPENLLTHFKRKMGFADGFYEIRHSDALDLVLKLIHAKNELTSGAFYFFTGISLERNIKVGLPEYIFNEAGETKYSKIDICTSLLNCLKQNLLGKFNEMDDEELINSVLLEFIIKKKLPIQKSEDPNSLVYNRDKRHYALEYANWHWKVPTHLRVEKATEH